MLLAYYRPGCSSNQNIPSFQIVRHTNEDPVLGRIVDIRSEHLADDG